MLSYQPIASTQYPASMISLDGSGSWWSDIPIGKRLGVTAVLATAGGAAAGFFQADRPGVGALIGGALGFLIWSTGWTVYTGVWTYNGIKKLIP